MPDAGEFKAWSFTNGQGPFPGIPASMPDWYSRQYLQMTSMSLDLAEAWLSGTRRLTDAWRIAMRHQQDLIMNGLHQQLDDRLAVPDGHEEPVLPTASRRSRQAPRASTSASA